MKIVQINTFSGKSTGTIMMNIHNMLLDNNVDSYVIWGRGRESRNDHEIYMNDKMGVYFHGIGTRITDKTGFFSKKSTEKIIKKLEEIKPDIIHLHNLHGYYINIEILFNYIKKNNIKVVWTFHDCWPFTGHCPHFEYIGCDKWKTCCHDCPQLNEYPKSLTDNSKWNFIKKSELFSNLDMTIVTPSLWLKNLVDKSFLSSYNSSVINNGIDGDIFKYSIGSFRKDNNLLDKKIILGVASTWNDLKGLKDFIELASIIKENMVIVLVGLTKKQIELLPKNIIGIERTESANELAELYSTADVFFNPTYADNFPTTNLESLACGTPVCTYNTGGSPESLNESNGLVVKVGDYKSFYNNISNLMEMKREHSILDNKFYKKDMLNKYLELYNSIKED